MCIFAALFQVHPDYPLFVLANRDESRSRPTEPPVVHRPESGMAWLGGTDIRAGGTWLGVNANGLLVAVTNRAKSDVAPRVQSRGTLCRELLAQPTLEAVRGEFDRQWSRYDFAGFNLLLFSRTEAVVIEAGDEFQTTSLTPGIHTVANRDLDDPGDPRVLRARAEVELMRAESTDVDDWIRESKRIVALHAEGDEPGLCLHRTEEWGTVSSTILALAREPGKSRYLYAAGPPCETPFADCSPLLNPLLDSTINT